MFATLAFLSAKPSDEPMRPRPTIAMRSAIFSSSAQVVGGLQDTQIRVRRVVILMVSNKPGQPRASTGGRDQPGAFFRMIDEAEQPGPAALGPIGDVRRQIGIYRRQQDKG